MRSVWELLIKRPLFLSGIICSILSAAVFYFNDLVLYIATACAVGIGLMIFFKTDKRVIFAVSLVFIYCIGAYSQLAVIADTGVYVGTTHKAEFILCEVTHRADEYYIANIRVEKSDLLNKGLKISAFYSPYGLEPGDSFTADITLNATADDSYKRNSYSDSVYFKGSISNITPTNHPDPILKAAEKIRNYIKSAYRRKLDLSSCATAFALLYGEREYFTDAFNLNVRASGVSHVMVVSGMHLAIITGFILKLCEKRFYNRFLKAFIMLTAVGFLSLVCGFTMSILRAGVTYMIMAVGIVLGRRGTAENNLGGAVTAILCFSPFAIHNISFQLSVLSTFGILVIAVPVTEKIKKKHSFNFIISYITDSCIFSLSATIFTLPVSIYSFSSVSLVAIVSNLLISFAVTAVMYIMVCAVVINIIAPFASFPFFYAAGVLLGYINFVIEYMGSMSFALVNVNKNWGYVSLFVIFLVLILLVACKNRSNMLKLKKINEKLVKEGGENLKWRI